MARQAQYLAVGLGAVQLLDAAGNALAPRRRVDAHLNHLGLSHRLRPLLPLIKVGSSLGLIVGLYRPRLGAVTAAALVAFYSAAAQFHVGAGDRPVAAVPAVVLGATAAVVLVNGYLPAVRSSTVIAHRS